MQNIDLDQKDSFNPIENLKEKSWILLYLVNLYLVLLLGKRTLSDKSF